MTICDEHTYCCDGEDCSCTNGTGTVSFEAGTSAFTTIGVYHSQSASIQMTSISHSNNLSSVLLPTATSSNSNTLSPEPQSTDTLSSAQSQPTERSHKATKIGIGVGVPVACLIIGGITAFLVLRRSKHQMQRDCNNSNVVGTTTTQPFALLQDPSFHTQWGGELLANEPQELQNNGDVETPGFGHGNSEPKELSSGGA